MLPPYACHFMDCLEFNQKGVCMSKKLNRFLALESAEVVEQRLVGSEEPTVDVETAAAELGEVEEALDESLDVHDELSALANQVQTDADNGKLSQEALSYANALARVHLNRVGLGGLRTGMESTYSPESIGKRVKDVWEMVKKFFAEMLKKLKAFFSSSSKKSEELKEEIKQQKVKLQELDKEIKAAKSDKAESKQIPVKFTTKSREVLFLVDSDGKLPDLNKAMLSLDEALGIVMDSYSERLDQFTRVSKDIQAATQGTAVPEYTSADFKLSLKGMTVVKDAVSGYPTHRLDLEYGNVALGCYEPLGDIRPSNFVERSQFALLHAESGLAHQECTVPIPSISELDSLLNSAERLLAVSETLDQAMVGFARTLENKEFPDEVWDAAEDAVMLATKLSSSAASYAVFIQKQKIRLCRAIITYVELAKAELAKS